MKKYDVCVIGAGPAGYAAAMRAVDFRKHVILVERNQLGGAGVHQGALWSKTWWELSREASVLQRNSDLLNQGKIHFDFKNVKEEVSDAVKERVDLLSHHMHNINLGLNENYFEFVEGNARVKGKHEVEITTKYDEIQHIEADYIILATGSRPRKLPDIEIDEEYIFTSDGLSNLEQWPKTMVILGAGVIGCEFATIFSNFGETKVHLIDKGDRILRAH
jgi:dihydrolipoamide dehydrogenase